MSPLLGIAGICYALYFVFTTPSGGFQGYYDKPSLVLLLLTPPCIMLLSHTLADFFVGAVTLMKSLFRRQKSSQKEVINFLSQASAMIRSQGMGSLVSVKDKISYDLLRDGVTMIVNNFTADEIRHNLTAKINAKQSRMELAANLFENMAKVSPGVGMIGTLLGLIDMMANLTDPSKIGGGMALAMITTLYGLLLGRLLYGPCSEKISLEKEKSTEIDLMVLEGVISLKSKKSSLHMKDIMNTYGSSRGSKNTAGSGKPRSA